MKTTSSLKFLKTLLYTEKLQIQGTESSLIFRKEKLEPEVLTKSKNHATLEHTTGFKRLKVTPDDMIVLVEKQFSAASSYTFVVGC
jgi:hypothetical protein